MKRTKSTATLEGKTREEEKGGSESKNVAAGSEKLDQVLVTPIKVEIRLTVWMQSDIVSGALLAGDNVFWQDEMSEVN